MDKHDLIIIGAGPAGITAAIYAARRQLKTLIITKDIAGQMAITNVVENYPGFEKISGFELMHQFKNQAEKSGAKIEFKEVTSIKKKKNEFIVKAGQKNYSGRAVILSFGLAHRRLKVPGEDRLKGKGVAYCATCDGPLFKNKIVGVVGGGNSALESAEYLSQIAKRVLLIHHSDEFRAAAYLIARAKAAANIEFYCFSQIRKITGRDRLEKIVIANSRNKKTEGLALDGLFVEIGYEPKTDWLKGLVRLNRSGEIITDRRTRTSQPGIFAAGDCTDIEYKQIVISAGAGAKAALEAYKYLARKNDGELKTDWGRCELVGSDKTVKIRLE